jgi:hypothetical protein
MLDARDNALGSEGDDAGLLALVMPPRLWCVLLEGNQFSRVPLELLHTLLRAARVSLPEQCLRTRPFMGRRDARSAGSKFAAAARRPSQQWPECRQYRHAAVAVAARTFKRVPSLVALCLRAVVGPPPDVFRIGDASRLSEHYQCLLRNLPESIRQQACDLRVKRCAACGRGLFARPVAWTDNTLWLASLARYVVFRSTYCDLQCASVVVSVEHAAITCAAVVKTLLSALTPDTSGPPMALEAEPTPLTKVPAVSCARAVQSTEFMH